jgi:methionine synthase reductase
MLTSSPSVRLNLFLSLFDSLLGSPSVLLTVCSTTGNGDSPENADSFWRAVKKRTLPKDLLSGLKFCVLALGDSNYDKFCFMGKAIDKRFSDLSATRVMDIFCADEATDLEEVVESWKLQSMQVFQEMDADSLALESASKILEDLVLNPNDSPDSINETQENPAMNESESDEAIVPCGVLNISEIVNHFGVSVDILTTPDSSLLPKSRKHNENSFEIILERRNQSDSELGKEWNVSKPFLASVNYAKWLTKPPELAGPLCPSKTSESIWESTRDVILLDLNIHLSGILYQPGDSIAICVPNPEKLVNCVIERLQTTQPSLQKETWIRKSDGEELTLQELLSYRLDLVSIPKKAVVLALADYCNDPNEANALRWVCAKGETGKLLWKSMFEDQCVGVGELLALYPSCQPSLHCLISLLSPLPPRAYSIATSPLLHPSSLSIAMSLVRYCCVSGGYQSETNAIPTEEKSSSSPLKVIKRSGLCTSYLHHLLNRWLYPLSEAITTQPEPPLIRIFHKPSATFHLPGSVAPPLVLIGPGTGVAPFIGFLSHRAALERERKMSGEDTCTGMWRGGYEFSGTCDIPCEGNMIDEFLQLVVPGNVHLYFGCRSEHDWIFRVILLPLSPPPSLS